MRKDAAGVDYVDGWRGWVVCLHVRECGLFLRHGLDQRRRRANQHLLAGHHEPGGPGPPSPKGIKDWRSRLGLGLWHMQY